MRLPHSRRGNVLTWFAVLLFVLLPLAALVIDFGFVLLTRRQMQTGVNAAALEGLRFEDEIPEHVLESLVTRLTGQPCEGDDCYRVLEADPEFDCVGAGEDAKRDYLRRVAARQLIRATYDDDLLATDDSLGTYGAGSNLSFVPYDSGNPSTGIQPTDMEFIASRRIDTSSFGGYQADPQLNRDNEDDGDMGAGAYDDVEFVYGATPDANQNEFDAFAVNLRRLSGPSPNDGAKSWGAPVPYLFGRGANTAAVSGPVSGVWDSREQGVQLRATAIARAAPAMMLGLPVGDGSEIGHLAFEQDAWNALPLQQPTSPVELQAVKPLQVLENGEVRTISFTFVAEDVLNSTRIVLSTPFIPETAPPPPGLPVRATRFSVAGIVIDQIEFHLTTVHLDDPGDLTIWETSQPVTLNRGDRIDVDEVVTIEQQETLPPRVVLGSGIRAVIPLSVPILNDGQTVIVVPWLTNIVDPNGLLTASFEIEAGARPDNIPGEEVEELYEVMRVRDISNIDRRLWTVERAVRGTASPHLSGVLALQVPKTRVLTTPTNAVDTELQIQSVVTPLDPNLSPAAYYDVCIDQEIMQVMDIQNDPLGFPTRWMVQRGRRGSVAAPHSANSLVRPIETGWIDRLGRLDQTVLAADSTTLTPAAREGELLAEFDNPASDPGRTYRLRIGAETMRVLERTATSLSVERGVDGTIRAHEPHTPFRYWEAIYVGDSIKRWLPPFQDEQELNKFLVTSGDGFLTSSSNDSPRYSPTYQRTFVVDGTDYERRVVGFIAPNIARAELWDHLPISGMSHEGERRGFLVKRHDSKGSIASNGSVRVIGNAARDLIPDVSEAIIDAIIGSSRQPGLSESSFVNVPVLAPATR